MEKEVIIMRMYLENLGIEIAGGIISLLLLIFGENKKVKSRFRLAIFTLFTLFVLDILNEIGVISL